MTEIKNNQKIPSNLTHKINTQIPLKFKGIILKSIFQKHRLKETQCLKQALFLWYIQKKDNQMIKDSIDRILITQQQKSFTSTRFFYRMKLMIRKEKESVQQQNQSIPEKIHNEDSQINQNGVRKNFTQYFESLKNIFSMKLMECENQLRSKHKLDSNTEIYNMPKQKHLRFKTEGHQVDDSMSLQSRVSIFTEQESQRKPAIKLGSVEQERVKRLGSKVGVTLIKSTLQNVLKRLQVQGFLSICQSSTIQLVRQKGEHINKDCLTALQTIVNSSSQSHSQVQSYLELQLQSVNETTPFQLSRSFLESDTESQQSIPPLNYIDSQINQVQYSIQLLNNAIRKDEEVQQLYKEFQSQYQEFQAIQKDFQQFKVRTKNSIFERSLLYKKKSNSFSQMKKYFNQKNLKKTNDLAQKSKVNIKTIHEIFNKSLKLPNNITFQSYKHKESQKEQSITSIKVLEEFNTYNKFKSINSQANIKEGIKKQNLQTTRNIGMQDNKMGSTFDGGFNRQKTKVNNNEKETTSHDELKLKTHVNFKLPNSSLQSQLSDDYQNSVQSSMLSKKQQGQMKKKPLTNNPIFYDLSTKTLGSNQSFQTLKYHMEIKSQYWQDGLEQKQNFIKSRIQQISQQILEKDTVEQ